MRIFLAIYLFLIVAVVTIMGFRGDLSTKPPIEVFPDMDRQARYKPQAENDFFDDGRNNRSIPANTVARGDYFSQSEVFSEDFTDDTLGDQVYMAGKNLDGSFTQTVPVDVTHELMALGQAKVWYLLCGLPWSCRRW
jgi:hypothetical protein